VKCGHGILPQQPAPPASPPHRSHHSREPRTRTAPDSGTPHGPSCCIGKQQHKRRNEAERTTNRQKAADPAKQTHLSPTTLTDATIHNRLRRRQVAPHTSTHLSEPDSFIAGAVTAASVHRLQANGDADPRKRSAHTRSHRRSNPRRLPQPGKSPADHSPRNAYRQRTLHRACVRAVMAKMRHSPGPPREARTNHPPATQHHTRPTPPQETPNRLMTA
jgi:hypothetical protein